MAKTLFNSYSENYCAFCKLHNCAITVKQLKHKECLSKQCWHLEKNEDHQYWHQREVMKQKRKARKLALSC